MLIKNYDAGSLDPKLYIQQENLLINFYNNLLNAAENLLLKKILGKPKIILVIRYLVALELQK